jgi:hypothetical protein
VTAIVRFAQATQQGVEAAVQEAQAQAQQAAAQAQAEAARAAEAAAQATREAIRTQIQTSVRQDARDVGQQIREAVREQLRAQVVQLRAQAEAAEAAGEMERARGLERAADRMEERVEEMDTGESDQSQVVTVSGQPTIPPWLNEGRLPDGVMDLAIGFFITCVVIAIGVPLARAFARRMDRKHPAPAAPMEVTTRLDRIEQAVDAIALEVERVSEGQRFTTKVLSELRALPQPNPLEHAWQEARSSDKQER